MQENLHLCFIACRCVSGYCYIFCLIQHIYQILLDFFVLLIIQRIDTDGLVEDFRKISADGRYREGNDGKAGLISGNILIHYRHGLVGIGNLQLLLLFA